MPLVEQDYLIVAEWTTQADRLCSRSRDPCDLSPGLLHSRGAVDAEDVPSMLLRGEARDHAGLRRPGHGTDDDRVEEDPEGMFLL